jgi:hypothetical protein
MESHLARIANNILLLLVLGFMGWIIYVKLIKGKSIDLRAMFGKFNLKK